MPEKPTPASGYPPGQVARVKSTCLCYSFHCTLHHPQLLSILQDYGFGPSILCIKRREGDRRDRWSAVENVPFFCRGEERKVNRILICFLRRECAGKQHIGLRHVLQRNHTGYGQLVHRNRSCLVDAKNVHRCSIFRGAEAGDQHATLRQFLRPNGHAHSEHHGE